MQWQKQWQHNGVSMAIEYEAVVRDASESTEEELITFLLDELPYLWLDDYLAMTPRQTAIERFPHGGFEYIYDDYATLENTGAVPYSQFEEARLVAAIGRSEPQQRKRDDSRLRGWVGPTQVVFGQEWDKGHYIAHSIGGAVDGLEANVFQQRRDLNRGWSVEGKMFRTMENYCAAHRGTLCFHRPQYSDGKALPTILEFGVLLLPERKLWVERFTN